MSALAVVTTATLLSVTRALKRSRTSAERAMAASAVASASMVVPRSSREAVASTSPLMVTAASWARLETSSTICSRVLPETSTPPTLVPGTAVSA